MLENVKQEWRVTKEQIYLQELLEKFNANPADPSLKDVERILMKKIQSVKKSIYDLSQQIETLNNEIKERQDKGNHLVQQLVHLQGQSQGFVDSLLALR